MRAFTGGHTLD